MKRIASVLLLALLPACGSDSDGFESAAIVPVPGCEDVDHAACDIERSACQKRLFEIAVCLRGGEEGTLPPVSRMSVSEFTDYLNASFDEEPPPNPDHEEVALVLLGLVERGALSREKVVETAVQGFAGFYRHDGEDIVIIEREDAMKSDDEQASALLIHEFVHALQDQSVDIEAFYEAHATSADAALAIRALIEGEARLHEDRYRAALLGIDPSELDWERRYRSVVERQETHTLEQVSAYAKSALLFPYAWGSRYMNFAWQAGGVEAVLEQFDAPPLSSQRLMASERGLAESFEPTSPPAPLPPAEWTEVDHNVLGAWGTFLAFSTMGSRDTAHALALAWRGDGVWIYANGVQTTVVWKLEFADEASASLARSSATAVAPNVRHVGTSVVLAESTAAGAVEWAFSE